MFDNQCHDIFLQGFSYSRIAVWSWNNSKFHTLIFNTLYFNLILKQAEIRYFLVGNEKDFIFISKRLAIHGATLIKIISPVELKNFITAHNNGIRIIICLDDINQIHEIEKICDSLNIPYFIYPKTSQIFFEWRKGGRYRRNSGYNKTCLST